MVPNGHRHSGLQGIVHVLRMAQRRTFSRSEIDSSPAYSTRAPSSSPQLLSHRLTHHTSTFQHFVVIRFGQWHTRRLSGRTTHAPRRQIPFYNHSCQQHLRRPRPNPRDSRILRRLRRIQPAKTPRQQLCIPCRAVIMRHTLQHPPRSSSGRMREDRRLLTMHDELHLRT